MIERLSASKLHPGSWWLLGLSFAVLAGLTTNLLVLLILAAAAISAIVFFRELAPWSQSLKFYLGLALFILVTRLAFRVVFNVAVPEADVAISLPQFELNLGFGFPVLLLGDVSFQSLRGALVDGLRLATIVLSLGMANTLANPRKLLKSTPGALFEIATAVSVAINLAPQLIESLERVRRAESLRGRSRKLGALAGIVIPVLEDTIDKSLALAASMDARGFGRRGDQSATRLLLTRTVSLGAVCAITIGTYLLLATAQTGFLGLSVIGLGLVGIIAMLRLTSAVHLRTRYRKQPLTLSDFAILALATLIAVSAFAGWVAV